jgi:hypothetical protein
MNDKLPTCQDYANFLQLAVMKFKISTEQARKKYGLFTYEQWKEVLK